MNEDYEKNLVARSKRRAANKYSNGEYEAELRRLYNEAAPDEVSAGIGWYATATEIADDVAERFSMTRDTVAGVIAALSPQNKWPSNLVDAVNYCAAAYFGNARPIGRTFPINQERAWKIANGADWREVLKGPKVRAFAANISGDLGPVTVDLWATRAATGDMSAGSPKSEAQRQAIVKAYETVAEEFGLLPAQFQAIIWCVVRGSAG